MIRRGVAGAKRRGALADARMSECCGRGSDQIIDLLPNDLGGNLGGIWIQNGIVRICNRSKKNSKNLENL